MRWATAHRRAEPEPVRRSDTYGVLCVPLNDTLRAPRRSETLTGKRHVGVCIMPVAWSRAGSDLLLVSCGSLLARICACRGTRQA